MKKEFTPNSPALKRGIATAAFAYQAQLALLRAIQSGTAPDPELKVWFDHRAVIVFRGPGSTLQLHGYYLAAPRDPVWRDHGNRFLCFREGRWTAYVVEGREGMPIRMGRRYYVVLAGAVVAIPVDVYAQLLTSRAA